MNKKDFTIVILLALLIPAWMFIDQSYIAPRYAKPLPPPSIETTPTDETPFITTSTTPAISAAPVSLPIEKSAKEATPALEKRVVLTNEQLEIVLSSQGGGIIQATLFEYADENSDDSESVQFSYNHQPALSYLGISGLEKKIHSNSTESAKTKSRYQKNSHLGFYFNGHSRYKTTIKLSLPTASLINQIKPFYSLPDVYTPVTSPTPSEPTVCKDSIF